MTDLPSGTVTFLFTDLEGSSRLWEAHPEAMQEALARHDEMLRIAIAARDGHVVKGTGDGVHAAFGTARDAVHAAVDAQRALGAHAWGTVGALPVRMGLHTGTAELRDGDYYGSALNRAARLEAVAHGGQIVCSQATADLVRDDLVDDVALVDLGEHRLRDLSRPELVFQVTAPGLRSSFPSLRSLDAFPANLPVQRTALIGRERQLARIAETLERFRLVTLIGVGGVGKTRLAIQAAADLLDRYPDGAWLVPFAAITDGAFAASAVASAFGVAERPGVPAAQSLVDALRARRLLLVLDNCEHLLDSAARLVDTLLGSCPGVSIVVTSREALGVDGEQILPTPSLSLPERDAPVTVVGASESAAVELFCERARSVRPDFELTAANVSAVVELCTRLDGIPLAIELAAARVNAFTPADILSRLTRRFLLLKGGSRTALERHHTLRAAVDWSFDLCSEPERLLFARLSVFSGGFGLESAEAIGAGDGVEESDVFELLAGLVAKSMVDVDDSGASARFRLLETLRDYGHERLVESGEAEELRTRHARHFLALSAEIGRALLTPGHQQALELLEPEFENIQAAFDWFLETGDASSVAQLVTVWSLANIGIGAYRLQDRMQRVEAALALADRLAPSQRADLLADASYFASVTGEHTRAATLADESLSCARAAGLPPPHIAFVSLANVAHWRGDARRAIELIEEAIAHAPSSVSPVWNAFHLSVLGFYLSQIGDTRRAIEVGEQALAIARELGIPPVASTCAWQLALSLRPVDPERALALINEASAAYDIQHSVNAEWWWLARAHVQVKLGRDREALDSCRGGLERARFVGSSFAVPPTLELAARALIGLGHYERAAMVLGAAEQTREETAIPGGPGDLIAQDRSLTRLQEEVDTKSLETARAAGRALTLDQLITLVDDSDRPHDSALGQAIKT